ncbi:MAG: polysaccharide biosynthesis/export family protein [Bacteroidales bacterium]|nr:polysaccharide biosynthesis/export family protein [Bacteroidales bacterium]
MTKHLTKTVAPVVFLIAVSLASCVTNKKLTYLQYDGSLSDTVVAVTPADYKILPYDNLYIKVVTPDPKWSEMFNALPVTSFSISTTELSAGLVSYPVDGSGNIRLPYAGTILVAGKTLAAVTTEVEEALKDYVADAAVSVKMINNYVSLIGEVQKPGRYPIYKDRLNIFQALAMGNDLTEFSDRQKIQIIRQTTGGNIVKEFSLADRSIMSSEFFYVMPNDVIYAQPVKGRFFRMNTFPYSVVLSTITTFVLIWNVVK